MSYNVLMCRQETTHSRLEFADKIVIAVFKAVAFTIERDRFHASKYINRKHCRVATNRQDKDVFQILNSRSYRPTPVW